MNEEIRNNTVELIIFVIFEILFILSLIKGFPMMITLPVSTLLIIILMMRSAKNGRTARSAIEKRRQELTIEREARKQTEEKLGESRKIFQTFCHSWPEAILMADAQAKIYFRNPGMQKMFGFSEGEIMGKDFRELFVPDTFAADDNSEIIKPAGKRAGSGLTECKAIREDKSEFPAEIMMLPIFLYNQRCFLITVRDMSGTKVREEDLVEFCQTDLLTSLYNRIHFFKLATREMERAKRYSQPISLILMDIDDLKTINDAYGNETGDSVIRTLAIIVESNIRTVDIAGRINGGEIAVLLPATGSDMGAVTAERLREMAENTTVPVGEQHISFTVSAGVAKIRSSPFHLDILLRDADSALFVAKEKGKNRVEVCRYENETSVK
ncbi:MAG: diguanylate cyclase [Desulfococcaceae bacterium]